MLRGRQEPRIEWVPEGEDHPDGEAIVQLAAAAGLLLDDWQESTLRKSMRQRDSKWAAFEVAAICTRQNGKNGILEARELGGLFVLRERLLIHTAHLADTAKVAFRRLDDLIEANEWLSRDVKHVWRTNGHEAIELKATPTRSTGAGRLVRGEPSMIRFRTRTKGGGRGFSGDFVAFDEAMELPEPSHAAILPIMAARPNPQAWYTASAVDQEMHEHGLVLARLRRRGLAGGDPSLMLAEWSLDYDSPEDVPREVAEDPEAWAFSNPAFGIRIRDEHIANEQRSMDPRTFAVERLGVGDWPDPDLAGSVIDPEQWRSLVDQDSEMRDPIVFALDANPTRTWASIGASGVRPDGLQHIELVERHKGTGWCVDRVAQLVERHRPLGVVVEEGGPAASLVHQLEERGVKVTMVTSRQHAHACGLIFDAIDQAKLRHIGQGELTGATKAAAQRPLSDSWAWSRKASSADISPLVACTLAHWGSVTNLGTHRRGTPRVVNLSEV